MCDYDPLAGHYMNFTRAIGTARCLGRRIKWQELFVKTDADRTDTDKRNDNQTGNPKTNHTKSDDTLGLELDRANEILYCPVTCNINTRSSSDTSQAFFFLSLFSDNHLKLRSTRDTMSGPHRKYRT